jgi:glycosyltransferase involved in cell wall biosynthesis
MRILMINHEFTRSGASKVFLSLAMHLRASGHDITIFPINPAHGPVREAYVACGIPIRERIMDEWFDLAICNTICAAPLVRELGATVRTIWWIHEAEIGIQMIREHPDWIGAFSRAAVIVFQTPFQRDEVFLPFITGLDQRRIFVIPNGITAAADDPAAEAEVVPVSSGAIRVVSVGSVYPRKRYEDLVYAVAQLTQVSIECVICGTFLYLEPKALGIVQGSPDRFRLLDGLSDEAVRAWVKSADIFCLPSSSETQGIAVYEAALLAKALVVSDLPCYRGVFFHGREALLFPVGDVDLLAATLEALATRPSLRARLGSAAARSAAPYTERRFFSAFNPLVNLVV